jgi:hypothetical protein
MWSVRMSVWIGAEFVLFWLCAFLAGHRSLLRPGIAGMLALALTGGYGLRVLAHLQALRVLSFAELTDTAFLVGAILSAALLIACTGALLALFNLIWPRTLGGCDILILSCLGGTGVSLASTLYGAAGIAFAGVR